jgi:hypothetical protein
MLMVAITQLTSCKENTILPPDLVPDVDNINTFQQDTFSVITHTVYKDSLLTGGVLNGVNRGADADFSHAIGTILGGASGDAVFGKTIASVYLQVRPPSPAYSFTGTNQTIDSVILAVNYESAYGDTIMAQTQDFNLYRSTSNLRFDSVYYEFAEANITGAGLEDIKANVNFNSIRTDSPTIDGVTLRPRIDFKLSNTFITDLQNQTSATGFLDYPSFMNWLGGFYITPDSTKGNTLGYFDTDNATMFVYYRYLNSNSDSDTTVAIFPFDARYCARFNNIKRNYTGSPASNFIQTGALGGDSLLFVQGEPGLASLIRFPNIGQFPNAIINKAELTLTVVSPFTNFTDTMSYNIPPQMQLVYVNENGEDEVLQDYLQVGAVRVGGIRNWATLSGSQKIQYKFNISHTIQDAVTMQNSNFALKMSGARNDNPASNRVVLRGSGSNVTLEKPKLNIIFTKIQ